MSSCSGPGICGGARRRPPPPPEPLTADLSELSLDQGYHTLADCGPPRRRRDNSLSDALWIKILSYLEVSDLCRMSRVCRRWSRFVSRLVARPEPWRRVRSAGPLDVAARCAHARAGPFVSAVREWRTKASPVTLAGAQLLAATFRNITHLALTGCSALDSRALAPLVTDLVDIRHIDLTGCSSVDWPEWSMLEGRLASRKPPVEYIDLTDCAAVTDAGLCSLLHTCPALQYLYLRRCTLVTDAGVRWIPSYCALKELSVSDCTGVTDFGLYELAKLGPALRYLSVAKCSQVSDSGISTLARRCYKLRYLNARGCGAVGDDGAEAVARGCSRLRALDLGATDVSETGLQILARCCPNLKKLALRGCELIGDDGLEAVAYYCRGLTQLNIQDTPVTVRGYRAVKKYCKRCVIEHTNPGFC
ncbi:F-box/LRR-repeat protein 7 [Aricia agestis]|uniref:F-box/LRR-repeat protein 7 n=1 Tax=Aricia agestis TaxID=91739 RepID=UPI001C201A7C|nr:F-box/LRR-repeat protein 7 [Aricia agestis]